MNNKGGTIRIIRGNGDESSFLTRGDIEEIFLDIRSAIKNRESIFSFKGGEARVSIVLDKVKYLSVEENELYVFL